LGVFDHGDSASAETELNFPLSTIKTRKPKDEHRGRMIAGGSVESLKNRIAEQVFDRRFDQRKRQPTAAE
jgi:hypothetical protein